MYGGSTRIVETMAYGGTQIRFADHSIQLLLSLALCKAELL